MPIAPDTSKAGLFVGGGIVVVCLFVISILGIKNFAGRTTDLPFPNAEANSDVAALRKSANDGNPESQLSLAGMYYIGKGGVSKDIPTSVQWLTRSAEQGNVTAELILGLLYFRGEGVTKDLTTAKEWFAKAGHHGNAEAQYYLGIMFLRGLGVPVDREKAYVWLNLSKAQGNEEASLEFEKLNSQMTSTEIAEAQNMNQEKQIEIQQTIRTPENSVSKLLKEAQQMQNELREKADAAEAELERIKGQDGDASKILTKALPSVVTIIVPTGNDEVVQGTAFFVDDYTLITNFHVVEPVAYEDRLYSLGSGPPVIIIDDKQQVRLAQVIATGGGTNDLAALALSNLIFKNGDFLIEEPSLYPSLLLQTSPRQGQTVFAVGSPQSFTQSITKGIVSAIRTTNSGMEYIQTDAEITHGNSGGPLLNTSSEVVGVNTLSIEDVKFAIAATSVKEFLSNIPDSYKGVAYLDPSDFNSGSTGTQRQPTYKEPTQPTPPAPTPTPTNDCSEFGSHAFYSYAQSSCVCETGYYAKNNTCITVPNCVSNSTFNYTTEQCECYDGYLVRDGKCVSAVTLCGFMGKYNPNTQKCVECDYGSYLKNGDCIREPNCGRDGTFNIATETCDCNEYSILQQGTCVDGDLALKCGVREEFDSTTEKCECRSVYVRINGKCDWGKEYE